MIALRVQEPLATMIMFHGKESIEVSYEFKVKGQTVICAAKNIMAGWNRRRWARFLESKYVDDGLPIPRGSLIFEEAVNPGFALGVVTITGFISYPPTSNREPWVTVVSFENPIAFAVPFQIDARKPFFELNDDLVLAALQPKQIRGLDR